MVKKRSEVLKDLQAKKSSLDAKKEALRIFLYNGKPKEISDAQWSLMGDQYLVMESYSGILKLRIEEILHGKTLEELFGS